MIGDGTPLSCREALPDEEARQRMAALVEEG